jgi:rubrerythrin
MDDYIQRCPECERLVNRAINGDRCPHCQTETFEDDQK